MSAGWWPAVAYQQYLGACRQDDVAVEGMYLRETLRSPTAARPYSAESIAWQIIDHDCQEHWSPRWQAIDKIAKSSSIRVELCTQG